MNLLKTDNSLSIDAERKIIAFKEAMEAIEEQEKEFKNQLLQEMKKRGITGYKDENITISLIIEGESERFDTKAFKKKFPAMHKKFAKITPIKEHVRLSIKKGITSDNMITDVTPEVEQIKVVTNGEIEAF
ncbi:hypothetical protein MKC88_12025 [[Clostridium] innocuum]|nr:hypothetical protein [[Clostridium] innocuum]